MESNELNCTVVYSNMEVASVAAANRYRENKNIVSMVRYMRIRKTVSGSC
jgi:hypothetical protein